MSVWIIALHGIRYRLGRSLLVLLIATIGVASAVATVAYMRATEQSVLTDALRSAPAYQTDIVLDGLNQNALPASQVADVAHAEAVLERAYAGLGVVRSLMAPVVAADDTEALIGPDGGGYAMLGYRSDVCAHLTIAGACPTATGQVMVSRRTADALHVQVGSRLPMQLGIREGRGAVPAPDPHDHPVATVVGIYALPDPTVAYWNGDPYFAFSTGQDSPNTLRYDVVFTDNDQDVRADPNAYVQLHLEVPGGSGVLRLDDVPVLRAQLAGLARAVSAKLTVTTGITAILDEAATEQHSLATTIPVAAVPLGVLAAVVLFLVVAALGEERAPELALAKLRGFASPAAARFGAAEAMLLIGLAGLLGLVVGVVGVRLPNALFLAHGTGVELRWQLLLAAVAAVAVGCLAVWLATRARLRQGVLDLIRRVPTRAGRGGSLLLGALVAISTSSIVVAYLAPTSPVGWLAAPCLAIVAGLGGARLLALFAAWRLRRAAQRGRIVGLISGAWIARQPGRGRVVAVLTVAVAQLAFGAIGWDAAAQARRDAAVDSLGAQRVYDVLVPYPEALMSAVHAADPGGDAMAVEWTTTPYGGRQVPLYAVDTTAMAKVALWRGESPAGEAAVIAALRPDLAPQFHPTGRLAVTARVDAGPANTFVLQAMIQRPGEPAMPVMLGLLQHGTEVYRSDVTGCADGGCRFLGLTVSRLGSGISGTTDLSLEITDVTGDGITVHDFSDGAYWAATAPRTDGVQFAVTPGQALGIHLVTGTIEDESVAYRDTPDSLPVVVSGGAKAANPAASNFSFAGLDTTPTPMTVVGRVTRVPGAGTDAILADLGVATRIAERSADLSSAKTLGYQVWADPAAPADLGARLAAHGITVRSSRSTGAFVAQMARSAPMLSFWFYLMSGVIALLLAIGVVLVGVYVGAEARSYAYAALRLSGVPPGSLRASLRREYRWMLVVALVAGALAGALGALLILPGIPLVTAGGPRGNVPYGGTMVALYGTTVAVVLVMVATVLVATRVVRRGTPARLRDGVR